MKKIGLLLMAAIVLAMVHAVDNVRVVEAAKPSKAAKTSAPAKTSCKTCHADFPSLVPQGHPPVKGNELSSCTTCHQPGMAGTEKKNTFSTRIHTGHLPPKGKLDCVACHQWSAGKKFGLVDVKESWGTPTQEDLNLMREIFTSWASSEYMDNLHAKAFISCANCHGKELPAPDTTVENGKCLECHGPMDQLVKKTEPAEFKDRNPHKSHLGEIACTVCHKAHSESKVYCLGCHQKFEMKIKGAGTPK
ncbi:MAG: cytochrome c3 family protein [Smithella sp.]